MTKTSHGAARVSRALAVAGALLLQTAVPLVGYADDAPLPQEQRFEWTQGTPDVLKNGEPAVATLYFNHNTSEGTDAKRDVRVQLKVEKGGFTKLPDTCDAKTSTLADERDRVDCYVKAVPGGSAYSIDVPVRASGVDGDQIKITANVNGTDILLRPLKITADHGVAIWFENGGRGSDAAGSNADDKYTYARYHPGMIGVPVGAANLKDGITFDVTMRDGAGVPASTIADLMTFDEAQKIAATNPVYPTQDVPYCSAASPNQRMSVKRVNPTKWTVTLTGFNTDPARAHTFAADGTALAKDFVWIDNFCLGVAFENKDPFGGPDKSTWSYDLDISNVRGASHVDGVAANLVQPYPFKMNENGQLTRGRYRAMYGRSHYSFYTLDTTVRNPNDGVGSENDGRALTVPGDYLSATVMDRSQLLSSRAGGNKVCLIRDPGKTSFDKNSLKVVDGGYNFDIEYSTTTPSDPTKPFCNTGKWSKLTDSTPDNSITAIRVVRKSGTITDKSPYNKYRSNTVQPGELMINAFMKVNPSLKPGDHVRMYGQAVRPDGSVVTPENTGELFNVDGEKMSIMNDRATVVGSRVNTTKTCTPKAVAPGENVECTVKTLLVGVPRSVTTTDTLPDGWTVVSGGKADSKNRLTWTETIKGNETKTHKYTLKAPYNAGNFTNKVSASFAAKSELEKPFSKNDAAVKLAVQTQGESRLVKSITGKEFAINGQNQWKLSLTNNSTRPSNWSILDILPYNGDKRGTKYTGDYKIDAVNANNATVYYTSADPSTIKPKPSDNKTTGGIWSTTKPSKVTGIWIVGKTKMPGGGRVEATIDWTTSGNKGEDKYVNGAVAQLPGSTKLQMIRAENTSIAKPDAPVQVDKSFIGTPLAIPGHDVEYTVTVKNPSKSPVNNVELTDLGGQGMTFKSLDKMSQGTVSGNVWKVGTLGAGETATARAISTINKGADLNKQMVNTVIVGNPDNPPPAIPPGKDTPPCEENEDVDSDTDQCDTSKFKEESDLKVDKELVKVDAKTDAVTWKITAHNVGPGIAAAVKVHDEVFENASDVKLSKPSTGDIKGSVWNVGNMKAGATETVTVTSKIVDHTKETVNSTTIENPTHPKDPKTPLGKCIANEGDVKTDTDQCDKVPYIEKSVLKTVKSIADFHGDKVQFNVEFTNAGEGAAQDVTLEELPSKNLKDVKILAASAGKIDGNKVIVDELKPGQVVRMTVEATIVNPTVEAYNDVIVYNKRWPKKDVPPHDKCKPNDDLKSDDDRCDTVKVFEDSTIKINKEETSLVENKVEYKVEAVNEGPDVATNVLISEIPSSNLKNVRIVETDKGDISGDAQSVFISDLKPNEPVTMKVTAEVVDMAKDSFNTATVRNPRHPLNIEQPGDPDNQTDDGPCKPNDELAKDDDQCDFVKTGEDSELKIDKHKTSLEKMTVEYDIDFINSGKDVAYNVEAVELPSDNLKDVKIVSTTKGEITEDGVSVKLYELAPDEKVTMHVTATIIDPLKPITNKAIVRNPRHPVGDDPECKPNGDLPSDDDQCDEETVKESSDLKIDKSIVSTAADGTVTYKIDFTNAGEDTAWDVVVEDIADANLKGAKMSDATLGEIDESGTRLVIESLKPGETGSVTVTAMIVNREEDARNNAIIHNLFNPPTDDPNGNCKDNNDLASDDDRCDFTVHREDSELKVDKKLDKVQDGKAFFTIIAKNIGPDTAKAVLVRDALIENLSDLSIDSVSTGKVVDAGVYVEELKAGETVEIKVSAKLLDSSKKAVNKATVENPRNPLDPNGTCKPNDSVDSDDDRCDLEPVEPVSAPVRPTPPKTGV